MIGPDTNVKVRPVRNMAAENVMSGQPIGNAYGINTNESKPLGFNGGNRGGFMAGAGNGYFN